MYFFREFLFLPLPCGHVAECEELVTSNVDGTDYVECSWCATTIERIGMRDWLGSECSPIVYVYPPAPDLIRVNNRVLEVLGIHQCGAPVVRVPRARQAVPLAL